jgi:hypothetical protein
MTKVSKSPQRHTFQKEGYVKRQEEKGEAINENYLDMFDKILNEHEHKFDDPKSHVNNLEYDLLTTEWILDKVRSSDSYAQNLYAALCNVEWRKRDLWTELKEENWGCSWRYAGGIIADMQQKGDYIDWYCSGMGGLNREYEGAETNEEWQKRTGYVPEATVTEEIERDLNKLGWTPIPYDDEKNIK